MIIMFGCASASVVSWEGNRFTVCGNVLAGDKEYHKAMAKQCYAYHQVGGGAMNTGYSVLNTGNGNSAIIPTSQECRIYQCGDF